LRVRVVVTASPAPLYQIRKTCSRDSTVFTPFLLPVRYFECGRVEKDKWTTFSLPLIEGVCIWISSIWLLRQYSFCCPAGSSRRWSDCKGGAAMNVMYVLGGILSLGLLVYLMVALLKPEWF
jgi:K+-transporting ATPase KdpF subunit